MVEINLTRNERWLYEFVRLRPNSDITVEQIAEEFYKDRETPENWRGSIAAQMRILSVKLYALGYGHLDRVSRLGTGSLATYRFTPQEQSA